MRKKAKEDGDIDGNYFPKGESRDSWDLWDDRTDGVRFDRAASPSRKRVRGPVSDEDSFEDWNVARADEPRDSWDLWDDRTNDAWGDRASSPSQKGQRTGTANKAPYLASAAAAACVLLGAGLFLYFHSRPTQLPAPPASIAAPAPSPSTAPTAAPLPTAAPPPTAPAVRTLSGYASDDPIYYYRAGLSPDDADLYDAICAALENGEEQLKGIPRDDMDRILHILLCVCYDHPEYYWIENGGQVITTRMGDAVESTLKFTIVADEHERGAVRTRLADVRESFKRSLGSAGDYEKALAVYEYLIDNTIYDQNYGRDTLCDVMLHGRGDCGGYTSCAQYLLQQLGIPAIFVSGIADGENHAWNIVRLDGDWYQLDVTWGDLTEISESGDKSQTKSFAYFCLTDAEMNLSHKPDPEFSYPACTATACNYFVREGCLTDHYDEAWLLSLMKRELADGGGKIEFRTTTQEVFREYQERLVDDGRFWDLIQQLRSIETYSISTDDQLFVFRYYV